MTFDVKHIDPALVRGCGSPSPEAVQGVERRVQTQGSEHLPQGSAEQANGDGDRGALVVITEQWLVGVLSGEVFKHGLVSSYRVCGVAWYLRHW